VTESVKCFSEDGARYPPTKFSVDKRVILFPPFFKTMNKIGNFPYCLFFSSMERDMKASAFLVTLMP